jgi:four helix bundle protein
MMIDDVKTSAGSLCVDREALQERTRQFAIRVVKMVRVLPKDTASTVLARQLLRAATSVGANYAEASHASSRKHFITTMEIAQREARETMYWLKLIIGLDLISPKRLDPLLKECDELVAILTKSIITAKKRHE